MTKVKGNATKIMNLFCSKVVTTVILFKSPC